MRFIQLFQLIQNSAVVMAVIWSHEAIKPEKEIIT